MTENLPSTFVQREKYPFLPDHVFVPIESPIVPEEISGKYGINKKGEVKNFNTGNILSHSKSNNENNEYEYVSFNKNGNKKVYKYRVHRLIALIFIINLNENKFNVVNHINHVRNDNRISNLEWVSQEENMSSEKVTPINEKYLGYYVGYDSDGNEVERFNVRNIPLNKYTYESLRTATNKSKGYPKYKGLSWRLERPKRNIPGFSGNIDDYEWIKHWKYPGVCICKEGFIKVNNRISYYMDPLNSKGYVIVSIKQKSYRAHRIIMEYLVGRNLRDDEIVDHIDRNKSNNSFSNLRLTDAKGNISENINTIRYISNDIVVTDLIGKLLFRGSTRETYKFIFGEKRYSKLISPPRLSSSITNKKFICFKFGDMNSLFKSLEKVIIIATKDKKLIIGSYNSILDASNCNLIVDKIDSSTIQKRLKDGKLSKNGYYYLTGKEAVNLLKDLGYLDEIIKYNLKET